MSHIRIVLDVEATVPIHPPVLPSDAADQIAAICQKAVAATWPDLQVHTVTAKGEVVDPAAGVPPAPA